MHACLSNNAAKYWRDDARSCSGKMVKDRCEAAHTLLIAEAVAGLKDVPVAEVRSPRSPHRSFAVLAQVVRSRGPESD